VAKVSLSVEKTLLDRADAFARSHNLNRSELVSQSLARFIAAG
jgi:metal-responsive CopG/Arc/MetJ family transcriptional regulator